MSDSREESGRTLRDLFGRVKRVLPENQDLVTVAPETSVADALALMRRHGINQVPVLAGGEVLGVFSYRSFALGSLELPAKERDALALQVDQFLEDMAFASVHDALGSLLDELDLRDAVLVGSEAHLVGIVTDQDALRYFYGVASPYVMLREIELALRELLRASAAPEVLADCLGKTLAKHYKALGRPVPDALEDLSFHDYLQILRYKETFPIFQAAFGGTPHTVHAKLAPIPDLRNAVFHFRRELSAEEFDLLRDRREWLWKRVRRMEAARRAEREA